MQCWVWLLCPFMYAVRISKVGEFFIRKKNVNFFNRQDPNPACTTCPRSSYIFYIGTMEFMGHYFLVMIIYFLKIGSGWQRQGAIFYTKSGLGDSSHR